VALVEFKDYRIGQIIEDIEIVPADSETLDKIINSIIDHDARINGILASCLRGTTPERVETLLRCIMLAGIAELIMRPDLSPNMIISDYLSVTDAFYDKTEISLVNGVLDSASRIIKANEVEIFTDI
jgi:N utilization substance protein B